MPPRGIVSRTIAAEASPAMTRSSIRFFLPGPTYVLPEVRQAMTAEVVGHRSPGFRRLYESLTPRLQAVLRTRGDVLVSTGSATLMMESAVISTVESRVLNLVCGAFSERWHQVCLSLGKRADRLSVPWGQSVDPALVREALRRQKYEAVTVVHNETSTGVINPLEALASVVRQQSDALLLVDTVSSLAGAPVETDAWGLDVVLASVQKAMAVPPGLTVFTLSERAAERAARVENRGFYTDLLRYREKHRTGGTITTPAVSVFYALDRQLDNIMAEGMEQRWRRHAELQRQTAVWAELRGLDWASESSSRSPTVSCLRAPTGKEAPQLVEDLALRGFTIGGGYGKWKPETFRIGHMGEVGAEDLAALLQAVDESLEGRG
jgi:aspartate aminotransferase-like enzyme